MSHIYITGDTHGTIDYHKLTVSEWPAQKFLTKNDYLIICGDAGIRWNDEIEGEDRWLVNWYNSKPFTTLFIDGNHENHNALNNYPIEEWNGGKVHKLADSVYHLMRGQVFIIDGLKFFTMGGAKSTDRASRIPNISWWANEIPSFGEMEEGVNNLYDNDCKVDYVITHDCGTSLHDFLATYHMDSDSLTQYLDFIEFDMGLQFKHWYFGHHHLDKQIDDKHTCLYDKVEQIK